MHRLTGHKSEPFFWSLFQPIFPEVHPHAHYIIIICECEHFICVEDIQHKHNKHRKTDTKKRTAVGVTLLEHK